MEALRDLFGFLLARKKYWMLPLILALLAFGLLVGLTSGSALSPFIYTIF